MKSDRGVKLFTVYRISHNYRKKAPFLSDLPKIRDNNRVYRAVRLVAEAINKHYSDRLHFPVQDKQACDRLAEGFYKESGETVPGCIGCVDGKSWDSYTHRKA